MTWLYILLAAKIATNPALGASHAYAITFAMTHPVDKLSEQDIFEGHI
jgi:hypothetical protein